MKTKDLLKEQCHRVRISSAHNKECSEIVAMALGTLRRHSYEWSETYWILFKMVSKALNTFTFLHIFT